MSIRHQETPLAVVEKPRPKTPPMFRVMLLNDDFTPMDFVVDVLCRFFQKSEQEATRLMLQVHQQGQAVCGVYPRDVAESKVGQVQQFSRSHEHPLQCIMEKHHAE